MKTNSSLIKLNKNAMNKTILIHLVLSIILLTICLALSIKLLPLARDDAYIHFRIAENFANYFSPYFNVSEHVMSTSSFVWTALLAILAKLKFPLPITVAILNPFLTVLGSYVWSLLLINITGGNRNNGLSVIFQIIYIGLVLPSALGLMESSLALLLLGFAVLLILEDKIWGWILFSLAIFTRYEIVIFSGLFVLHWIVSNRLWKEKIIGLLYFIIPCIFISSVIFYFYSTIIPNTIYAKGIVYQLSIRSVLNTVFYSIFPNGTYPFGGVFYFLKGYQIEVFSKISKIWVPIFLSLFTISALLFPLKIRRNSYLFGFILLLGGIILVTLYVLKKTFIFDWYIPLYSTPIFFGIVCCVSAFLNLNSDKENEKKGKIFNRVLSIPIILLAFILAINPLVSFGINAYSALADISKNQNAAPGLRVQRYLEVGKVLYAVYPNARLLTSEIGGLGYSFKGEIIDGVGLITPRALAYHPMKVPEQRQDGEVGAIPAAFIGKEMPEIIVSYDVFDQEFDSSFYREQYTKIVVPAFSKFWESKTGLHDVWGSFELFIYLRNDIAKVNDINFIKDKLLGK